MPTPHKHAELIKAWADGAEIEESYSGASWRFNPAPLWNLAYMYRVKPQPHKWQKEMDAFKAGKTIQYRAHDSGCWFDAPSPSWAPGWEYRIKPETVRYRLYWCYTPDNQPKLAIAYADTAWLDGCVTWHGDWQEAEVPSV